MDSWGTILLGYGVVFGGIAAYAISVVHRGRTLGAQLGLDEPAPDTAEHVGRQGAHE